MAMTVSELQVKVSADTSEAESGLASLGSKVGSIGGGIATAFGTAAVGGIVAFGAAIAGSVAAAATFESAMSGIQAVSGATASEMQQLSGLALQLGADTSFSASEAADGIGELIKAGVSIGDVMGGGAAAALNLAAAGGLSVAESASIASNAMNVFSLSGAQTGHIADVIAGAANASAIDVHDFGMTLAAAGSVANTVGVGFEDLATATAVMGQAGIKGSDAGTSLKTMLLNLTPASKAQMAVAKQLGIVTADGANKFFDATGKARSMADIAEVLKTSTAGLTEQQKLQALQTLFGTDAIRAAAIMAKAGAEGFDTMAESIGKVTAADVAKVRLDNLKGSIEQLKGSLETAGIELGTMLLPSLKTMADGLTEWVNKGIDIIHKLPVAWADVKTIFSENTTDSNFEDLLSQLGLSDAMIVKVDNWLANLGDAWRTMQQAFAGEWSPSDQIDPFVDAVGKATLTVKDLGKEVDRVGSELSGFGGAFGNLTASFGQGRGLITLLLADFKLMTLTVGEIIDAVVSAGRAMLDFGGVATALGRALGNLAKGDIPAARDAIHDGDAAMADLIVTGEQFASRTSARVGEGMQAIATVTGSSMGTMSSAVETNMSAANAAVAVGSAGWQQNMEANGASTATAASTAMTDVATATETGMAQATAAVETGGAASAAAMDTAGAAMSASAGTSMTEVTSLFDKGMTDSITAVSGQTGPAGAAMDGVGSAMVTSLDAAAPAMAASAEQGATGAVAAVQAQQGPASAAGSAVGDSLGSGMQSGILAWVGSIASAAAQLVSSALGAARAEADSHSPSKKTEKLGQDMAEGLEIGLNKSGLGDEMKRKIRDFISDTREYIPVAGEIKRVEEEIKRVRDQGQTDYLFRAQEMITIDSEALRLKSDMVGKERDLIADRQRLAQATRDISNAERGSLTERTAAIQLGAAHAEQQIKINQLERDKIPLQERALELDRALLNVDPDSKRAKQIKEEQDEIRKKTDLIDNTVRSIQLQTRAQDLDADTTKNLQTVASAAAKIRREGLDDNVRAQQELIDKVKDQIDILGGEQSVFSANEAIIKNATQNEIDYRNRLIAVFTAEGKPLADRVAAGLKLVDQLHDEGKISDELYNSIKKVADKMGDAKGATAGFGGAAETAAPQIDAAAKKAEEMADQAQRVADQANSAASKVDALSSSLGRLPDWFHTGSGSGSSSLFGGGRADGGPVTAGRAYVVGERRPEVFVPNRSGTILPAVPSYSGGGGSGGDSITIDLRNAQVYDGSKFEDLLVHALGRAQRGGRIVKVTR